MSRLIDADALIKRKTEEYAYYDITDSEFDDLVNSQPTAFDAEKVVEQLEEKRNNYQDEMEQCIFKSLPYHDSLEGKIIGINNVIDIVKKGGVK